jgi:ABC-2 type transport system permease protein
MSKAAKIARVEKPGVIRDRGYQPYAGAYTPTQGRWALIARRMLRLLMPQWWVILLLVGAGLRLLLGAAVVWIKSKLAGALPAGAPIATIPNPDDSVLGILVDGTGTMLIAFMLALLAGGGAIADDARAGAFQFYFARPVSKLQYLVGKLVPALVLVGAVAIIPPLLLALLRIALCQPGEVLHKLPLVPAALGGGAIETVVLSLLALALSSLSSRRGYVQGAYATLFILPWIVGGIFTRVMRSPWPALLSIPAHLENVSRFLFRMRIDDEPTLPVWLSATVLWAIVAVSIAILRRRLEDIEVVQGS